MGTIPRLLAHLTRRNLQRWYRKGFADALAGKPAQIPRWHGRESRMSYGVGRADGLVTRDQLHGRD
jgi:hypothetical protein